MKKLIFPLLTVFFVNILFVSQAHATINLDVAAKDVNKVGGTIKTSWTSSGIDINKTLDLYLTSAETGIGYFIKRDLPLTGSYDWIIPNTTASAKDYQLSLSTNDKGPSDSSEYSTPFEIIGSKDVPIIKDVSAKVISKKTKKNKNLIALKYKTQGKTNTVDLKMNISCPEGVTVSGSKDIACSTWITLEKNKSGTLLINFENTSGTEQEIGFSFDLTNKDGSLIQRVFEFVKVPGSKEISPYVKVLSPNGGENLSKGGKYKIEWESKNIEKFDIYLDARWERGGPDRLIAANVKGNTLMWVVPDDIVSSSDPYPSNQTPEQYKINVMQSQGLKEIAGDFSDDFFNIGGSINESKASLVIHSPQGGETFANNQKILIGYAAKNISDTLVAYLYHPEYGQVAEYQEVATMPLGTGKGVIELDLAKYKTIDVIQAGEYKIGLCDPKSTGPGGDKDLCVWSNYFTVTDSSSPLTMCTFNRDLTLGSQGDDVSNLQYFLQTRGYLGTSGEDKGYFGASTQAALIKFKTSIGIYPADGYFGAMTRQKVTEQCLSGLKGSAPAYYSSSSIMSKKDEFELGAKNNVIKKIQQFLNSNGYSIETKAGEPGSSGYETDYFGEKTKQALIRFQKDKGITPAQGYFGPKTKAVMGI